jgi:hypothetical protein
MVETPSIEYFCRQCGYALRGLESHRCPECGREFDPEKPSSMSRNRKRFWAFRGIVLGLLTLSLIVSYAILYLKTVTAAPSIYTPPVLFSGSQRLRYPPPAQPPLMPTTRYPKSESYSYDNVWVQRLFRPANLIDRRLRPRVWTGYSDTSDHFGPAAESILRALESNKPELRPKAIHLWDSIMQTQQFRIDSLKWRQLDAMVWKEEAALRRALSE